MDEWIYCTLFVQVYQQLFPSISLREVRWYTVDHSTVYDDYVACNSGVMLR